MKLLKLQHHLHLHPQLFSISHISQNTPHHFFFLSPPPPPHPQLSLCSNFIPASPSVFHSRPPPSFKIKSLDIGTPIWSNPQDGIFSNASGEELEDLAADGAVYQKTLRLVECSMFSAVSGLAYFLSNSLAIENYFGCFFALPIVISSMRWSIAAGRKTMVATAVLLFVLSGPVKALTYLLMHGLVGLTMGSMWRLGASWGLSIFMCSLVRAVGAMGYVLLSSFLIRENILALITINVHASLTYIMTSLGLNAIPSMEFIYAFFGTLLLINCGFFVFLLHLLYAVFFTKLGMKDSLRLPGWLEKAL